MPLIKNPAGALHTSVTPPTNAKAKKIKAEDKESYRDKGGGCSCSSWREVKHKQSSWEGFVGPSSAKNYQGTLIRFVLHLFDSHETVITDKYVSKFDDADAYDKRTPQAVLRMKLRAAIASAIAEIEPSRDGNPYECFLKIGNEEGALSYQMVRDYMARNLMKWRWIAIALLSI